MNESCEFCFYPCRKSVLSQRESEGYGGLIIYYAAMLSVFSKASFLFLFFCTLSSPLSQIYDIINDLSISQEMRFHIDIPYLFICF